MRDWIRAPQMVRNMLLMANKYQVDNIRRQIVERLESDWPQRFVDWKRQQAEVKIQLEHNKLTNERQRTSEKPSLLDDAFPEPASAIRLARECNIPSILPAAFYHLSRLTIDDDWDSARRQRSEVTSRWGYGLKQRTVRWSILSGDDLRCMLAGKVAIRKQVDTLLFIGFCSQEDEDEDDEEMSAFDEDEDEDGICDLNSKSSTGYSKKLCDWLIRERETDLLKCMTEIRRDMAKHFLCPDCEARLKRKLDGDVIRQKLPEWFGLT